MRGPPGRLRTRNAPIVYDYVYGDAFANDNNATVYYLLGTTGWDMTFAGRPTVLCLAHVTNCMAKSEGDFEKGAMGRGDLPH